MIAIWRSPWVNNRLERNQRSFEKREWGNNTAWIKRAGDFALLGNKTANIEKPVRNSPDVNGKRCEYAYQKIKI